MAPGHPAHTISQTLPPPQLSPAELRKGRHHCPVELTASGCSQVWGAAGGAAVPQPPWCPCQHGCLYAQGPCPGPPSAAGCVPQALQTLAMLALALALTKMHRCQALCVRVRDLA